MSEFLEKSEFPALYQNADNAAINRQNSYYRILLFQYAVLVLAAAATGLNTFFAEKFASLIYLSCILVAAITQLYSTLRKPEREWYNSRALAESLKTLSWRFMMAVEPFEKSKSDSEAAGQLNQRISELLQYHKYSTPILSYALNRDTSEQITVKMENMRNEGLKTQIEFYKKFMLNTTTRGSNRAYLSRTKEPLLPLFGGVFYWKGVAPPLFLRQGSLSLDAGNSKNYASPSGLTLFFSDPSVIIRLLYLQIYSLFKISGCILCVTSQLIIIPPPNRFTIKIPRSKFK